MKTCLPLGLSVLLVACATPYTPPASGPRAQLRVIAQNADGYFAATRDVTQTCSRNSPSFPMLGGDSKPDAERLGMPGEVGPRADRFERRIAANQPLRLTASTLYRASFSDGLKSGTAVGQMQYQARAWACNVKIEFTPVDGAQYEMRYDFGPDRCDVHVDALGLSEGRVTRSPVPVATSPATCATLLPTS